MTARSAPLQRSAPREFEAGARLQAAHEVPRARAACWNSCWSCQRYEIARGLEGKRREETGNRKQEKIARDCVPALRCQQAVAARFSRKSVRRVTKLDVAGSTPVARSTHSRFFSCCLSPSP